MPATNPPPARVRNWRGLYVDALMERELLALPSRIDEAEEAIILQERELMLPDIAESEERQALNDALYALRALRHSLELKTNVCEVAY